MHELSIAQGIADVVEEQARICNAAHVREIRLKIGEANGVVYDSLTFCFEMIASLNPMLAGVQLVIDHVPHRAYCQTCHQDFVILNYIPQCPHCQQWSREIISGTELEVLEMEFASGGEEQ
ncbi:hydrogenase maturation nickel metallochaperone HypA/HybF [Tengunoibacter tsumagoiensis]|uniref:Hydrogenase maturation factor HypA n=1 Tax=Tengunoibacter tsumagoiensis TaxID=2014871 RepID=A0A402A199_9CHLR|nr:hydrogenase maturation nickel metallochaperone HypA [Tengunoibacter tsumagoiensis]GCE12791.1 putative hydrogenase nickel incorporation protein HypA [Tengunoibacter tsumagoiensis]